jgi:hypothetical protein
MKKIHRFKLAEFVFRALAYTFGTALLLSCSFAPLSHAMGRILMNVSMGTAGLSIVMGVSATYCRMSRKLQDARKADLPKVELVKPIVVLNTQASRAQDLRKTAATSITYAHPESTHS